MNISAVKLNRWSLNTLFSIYSTCTFSSLCSWISSHCMLYSLCSPWPLVPWDCPCRRDLGSFSYLPQHLRPWDGNRPTNHRQFWTLTYSDRHFLSLKVHSRVGMADQLIIYRNINISSVYNVRVVHFGCLVCHFLLLFLWWTSVSSSAMTIQ